MRTKTCLAVVLGAALMLPPLVVQAERISAVEATANSDGEWTPVTFPAAISQKAKVTVVSAACEKPKIEEVDFVLVPKGKCQGAAGAARPSGATHPDKLQGTLYTLSEKDLCAGTKAKEIKCVIYADTEW